MGHNKLRLAIGISLAILVMAHMVYSFGVTSSYGESRPLILQPGDNTYTELLLQNMVGDSAVTLEATLADGEDIAELADKDTLYKIPAQTKGITVGINIKIPQDMPIGTEKVISVKFREVVGEEGGMLQMGTAIVKTVPVVIGERPQQQVIAPPMTRSAMPPAYVPLAILLIVLIAAFLWYVLVHKKTEEKNHKK